MWKKEAQEHGLDVDHAPKRAHDAHEKYLHGTVTAAPLIEDNGVYVWETPDPCSEVFDRFACTFTYKKDLAEKLAMPARKFSRLCLSESAYPSRPLQSKLDSLMETRDYQPDVQYVACHRVIDATYVVQSCHETVDQAFGWIEEDCEFDGPPYAILRMPYDHRLDKGDGLRVGDPSLDVVHDRIYPERDPKFYDTA